MRAIFILLAASFVPVFSYSQATPSFSEAALSSYLKSHRMTPEKYVVSKFADHDIVFLGEFHRIKHDVKLIHKLIPALYKAGVYDLGIEFGAYEFQDKVDRLITADRYDETLARWVMFESLASWGFVEYEDIYRAAWKLNHSLPSGAPKFRVVNLEYKPNWKARHPEMTRELWQQVWHKGDPDEYMGKTILSEFVDKHRKALIYMGSHHAFTRYRQPIYDFKEKKFIRFEKRAGNWVFERIGDRAFNIFLHSPWHSTAGYGNFIYPAGGVIDRVMSSLNNPTIGFDIRGTPFGQVTDTATLYSFGYPAFDLQTFCDGYIFQKPFPKYEAVTIDKLFVTKDNYQEAMDEIWDPEQKKLYPTPASLIEDMRKDADPKRFLSKLDH